MKKHHNIIINDVNEIKKIIYNVNIVIAFNRQFALNQKRKTRHLKKQLIDVIDKNFFEYFYIRWIINSNLIFEQTINENFRIFIQYLNVSINAMFFNSNNTIKTLIQILFRESRVRIRYILNHTIFDIYIIYDVWNFSNRLNMLIVVIYFVNEKMQQKILLFFLSKFQIFYTKKNMIQIVLNTFDVYEIRNNLSYFVMNNAKNNDIMMKIISKVLLTKHDIEYDVVEHRLRCIDHIINLIVQTYLFDKHFNVEYRIIINVFVTKKLNDEFQQYRKFEF